MLLKPDPKRAVVVDFEVLQKVIKESLVVSGYRVHDCFLEVTKGFVDNHWIVEMKFEVER